MMCEARLFPLMKELPDASIILSYLTFATHHIDLALQLPLLCVMMPVVTMTDVFPEDKYVRIAWMDGEYAMMLALLTHIIICTMYKVFNQAQDHKLVLPVDVSCQPLKHLLLGAVDLKQAMEPRLLSPVDPLQHALEPRLEKHF